MTNDANEIAWLSLADVSRQIQSGQRSSVEITTALLARIDKLDTRLHSYATLLGEQALIDAGKADRELAAGHSRGALHGVPIALKDLCDTAGVRTMGGMPIYADRIPSKDATVVARLTEAGAVLLGKLQMTEGAFSAHHPDVTVPVNPWGDDLWSGVSSSGSGVATASALCFGSLGSDTLGSIRFPSAVNGITGLKPTWGRVSRAGVLPLAESMDHVGPMTRSAEDAAIMLAAIAGFDPDDLTSSRAAVPDYRAALSKPPSGVRLGVDREIIESHADAATKSACDAALDTFANAGFTITDINMPAMFDAAKDALQLCVAETALTHKDNFAAQPEKYGPVLSGLIQRGQQVDTNSLLQIQYRRKAFEGAMNSLFEDVDLILQPAMNVAAPTNEALARQTTDLDARLARLLFTAPIDMSRHPSLTLPGGATDGGLPVAIQLIAPHFAEADLLTAGHLFQQNTDWHRRRPPGL